MKSFRLCLTVAAFLMLVAPTPSEACFPPPGGSDLLYLQYLLDWNFDEGCNAWTFVNGATTTFNTSSCSSLFFSNLHGRLSGANGVGVIRSMYNDTTAAAHDSFKVTFNLEFLGPMTSWDRLEVLIRDRNTNQVLERVATIAGSQASSLNCKPFTKVLTGDYSFRQIRLEFKSTIIAGSSASAFQIDGVRFSGKK